MIKISKRIYVVDHDPAVSKALRFWLKSMAIDCTFFQTASEFTAALTYLDPGCILLDLQLPESGALRIQHVLRERNMMFPVIIMASDNDRVSLMTAMHHGVAHHLEMPFDEADLEQALERGFSWLDGGVDILTQRADAARLIASLDTTQTLMLRGIVAGMTTSEIAAALQLTPVQALRIRGHMAEQLGLARTSDFLAIGCAANLRPLDPAC